MRFIAAVALLALVAGAHADEAAVRRMIAAQLDSGQEIAGVRRLPFADLYEVAIRTADGPSVYYVDGDASVIIAGQILDTKSGRNLTEERLRKLSATA